MVNVEILNDPLDLAPEAPDGDGAAQNDPVQQQGDKPDSDTASDSEAQDEVPDETPDEEMSEANPCGGQPEEAPVPTAKNQCPLVSTVYKFLDGENLKYMVKGTDEETTLFHMHLTGNNGNYRVIVDVKSKEKRVLCLCESPVKVVAHRRLPAAEYLMRVNYSLAIGSFEMDFRDGEVRNRTSVSMDDGILTVDMVRSLIMVPAATTDRFFNGLMEVVYGNRPPEEAYEEARNPGSAGGSGGETHPRAAGLMQLLANLGSESS